jgi:hypothetical protein
MQRQQLPNSRRVSQLLTHLRHPPGMDLGHAAFELGCEVTAGEVDVLERARETAVTGERRDRVQFPAGPCQVSQAQVTDVCVLKRGTSARNAIFRTTFDQVHRDSGCARLRRDAERNKGPRVVLSKRRSSR